MPFVCNSQGQFRPVHEIEKRSSTLLSLTTPSFHGQVIDTIFSGKQQERQHVALWLRKPLRQGMVGVFSEAVSFQVSGFEHSREERLATFHVHFTCICRRHLIPLRSCFLVHRHLIFRRAAVRNDPLALTCRVSLRMVNGMGHIRRRRSCCQRYGAGQ